MAMPEVSRPHRRLLAPPTVARGRPRGARIIGRVPRSRTPVADPAAMILVPPSVRRSGSGDSRTRRGDARRSTSPRRSATCPASSCSRAPGPGGTPAGRYLTADPVAVLESPGRRAGSVRGGAAAASRGSIGRRVVPADAPPFLGGLVGFLGYDLGRRARAPAVDRARPTRTCRCSGSRSTTGSSPGTAGPGDAWLGGRALDGDAAPAGAPARRRPRPPASRPARAGRGRRATRRPTPTAARAFASGPRPRGATRPASSASASTSPTARSTRPT